MDRLKDKAVVITGGGSGIGLASARLFAEEGASLVLFGRTGETLEAARSSIDGDVLAVAGDITRQGDVERLVEECVARHGAVDVLFLNAGTAPFASIEESSEEFFDECFAVNVRGRFFAIRTFLPHLRSPASVILTATGLMHKPLPESSVWAAANAAVRSLAMSLSVDLAARGVRFNVLSPGPTDTPIYDGYGMAEDELAGLKEGLAAQTLLGRMARAEEMARVALFLASEESSYLVGEEIVAAGGYGLR
ncbi:MAG: SDR family oxidoreductase [Spirochaetales bacterium]|nr:SDR family oxidoreductase [Spirochaetales bacterium]